MAFGRVCALVSATDGSSVRTCALDCADRWPARTSFKAEDRAFKGMKVERASARARESDREERRMADIFEWVRSTTIA